jgi:N-acetylated-alpha-linked acidic dipeptidase
VNEVARTITDPKSGESIWEAARRRRIDQADSEKEKTRLRDQTDLPINALGSGSDYTAFLDHLNMAALNLSFGGAVRGGVGHSIYDTFAWYTRFSDSDFEYGRALSQTVGTTLLRLANATVLPFYFVDYADTIGRYADEIEETIGKMNDAPNLDLSPLRSAIDELRRAGESCEGMLEALSSPGASPGHSTAEIQAINRLLYTSERLLGHEGGLPDRRWFKHQVYAPGFYTGYGVKTLPGIREGVEEMAWDDAARYITIVSEAIQKLAQQVEDISQHLENLLI